MKQMTTRRLAALGLAAAMGLTLAACGEQQPSREEVEQAIEAGTLTVEDKLSNNTCINNVTKSGRAVELSSQILSVIIAIDKKIPKLRLLIISMQYSLIFMRLKESFIFLNTMASSIEPTYAGKKYPLIFVKSDDKYIPIYIMQRTINKDFMKS